MYADGEKSISVSVVGHKAKTSEKKEKKKLCGADDETFVPSHAFEVFTGVCWMAEIWSLTTGFFSCGCRRCPAFRRRPTNDDYLQKKQDDN